jgi:TolB protein
MVVSYEELGEPEYGIGSPDWSPDSQWIVFPAFIDAYGYYEGDLYKAKSDGSEWEGLGIGSSPTWSPDGTKIVFSCTRTCYYDDGPVVLYTMNADGTGKTQIVSGRKEKQVAGYPSSWKSLS